MCGLSLCFSLLAGCAQIDIALPSFVSSDVTASVPEPGAPKSVAVKLSETLNETDWQNARKALASALSETEDGETTKWQNAETRSTGLITPVAVRRNGKNLCRIFAITIAKSAADSAGLALTAPGTEPNQPTSMQHWRGDACRLAGGQWQIAKVSPLTAPLTSDL